MNEKKKLRRLPKRILSFVLTLAMMLTLMPISGMPVYANDIPPVMVSTSIDGCKYNSQTKLHFSFGEGMESTDYEYTVGYSTEFANSYIELALSMGMGMTLEDLFGQFEWEEIPVALEETVSIEYIQYMLEQLMQYGVESVTYPASVWVRIKGNNDYNCWQEFLITNSVAPFSNELLPDFLPIEGDIMPTVIDGEGLTGEIAWAIYDDEESVYVPTAKNAVFEKGNNYYAFVNVESKDGYGIITDGQDKFYLNKSITSIDRCLYEEEKYTLGEKKYALQFIISDLYIAGEGNKMMASYNGGDFNILGFFGGKVQQTTFNNNGYRTYLYVGDNVSSNYDSAFGIDASSEGTTTSGLKVMTNFSFQNEGQVLKLVYTVENTSGENKTFSLGATTDVQIGHSDGAIVSEFTDGSGFLMVSDSVKDCDQNGNKAQLNFWCQNAKGVTEVDSFWYGAYDNDYGDPYDDSYGLTDEYEASGAFIGWENNKKKTIFVATPENRLSAADSTKWQVGKYMDSAMSWGWCDRTIEAGATQNYSLLFAIGGPGSEDLVSGDFTNIRYRNDTITYSGELDFNVAQITVNGEVIDPATYTVNTTEKTIRFDVSAGLKQGAKVFITLGEEVVPVRNTIQNVGPKAILLTYGSNSEDVVEIGDDTSKVYFDQDGKPTETETDNYISYDPYSGKAVIAGVSLKEFNIPLDPTCVEANVSIEISGNVEIGTFASDCPITLASSNTITVDNISMPELIMTSGELNIRLSESSTVDIAKVTLPAGYAIIGGHLNESGALIVDEGSENIIITRTHIHSWSYVLYGATLKAYCTKTEDCDYQGSGKAVSLTLTASSANYSGSAYDKASLGDTSAWTGAGLTTPKINYAGRGNTTYTKSETAPTETGTYTASITAGGETVSVDFEIAKANRAGYTVSMADYEYNTTPSTPTLSATPSEGTVTYYYNTTNSNSGGTAWSGVTGTTFDTGVYYIYAVISESKNYKTFTTPAVSFTVTGATLGDVTATAPDEVTYDGAQHGIAAVTCATEGTTVNYGTVEGTYNLTTAPTFKDAGTHTIYYQVKKTGYTPKTGSVDVVINKKSITANVTAANKDYDGTTTATVTATVNSSDLASGDSITITGLTGTFANANAGDAKTVTVNTSAATVSGTGKDNYIISYGSGTINANINKIAPEMTVAPVKNTGIFSTLDTSKALVVDGRVTGGSFEYKVDDAATWSGIPTVSTLTAGTHTVYYRIAGDSNHSNLENSAWKIDIEVSLGNITVNATDTISPAHGVTATGATSSNLEKVVAIPSNVEAGKTINIKLEVEAKADTSVTKKTDMEAKAQSVLNNSTITAEYIDIKLNKTVDSTPAGTISDTEKPIEIEIAYPVASGKAYSIIREHDGTVTAFTQLTDKPTSNFVDGTYYVGTGKIYIYSRYFSDYMIGSVPGHSVIYNANGGSAVTSAIVAHNGNVALLPNTTRSGYTFAGWYIDNGTFVVPFTTSTAITANTSVYAKWVAALPPSPAPGNGGNNAGISPAGSHTHVAGDVWLYDHDLSREGYKLRHKACVICGEPMNYEIVDDNAPTQNDASQNTSTALVPSPHTGLGRDYVKYVLVCTIAMAGLLASCYIVRRKEEK